MSQRKDTSSLVKRAHDPNQSTDSSGSDVTTTERELANNAQWKLIQKNTFTRWANEHLKTVNRNIADLETDLADGLRLIALIEVLAGKKFQKYNKRPTMRTQKLENITMALRFLQVEEKIKIVSIDSSDIVDHRLKLILGLIWMLILHYSISMPNWEDEVETTVQKREQTPKQRLLAWIQNKVPDRQILNFTTDWNDGKAIGALVDGVAPGLCPDWEDWSAKDALPNATEAMDAAEKWLDVPQLIRPEEMNNPKVDEMSMMTYLSQFPSAKLKTGAPLRPRTNPSRVRTYGPGLDASGNSVGAPARFTVETFSAGKGELDVTVINPNGIQEPVEYVFNNDHYLTYSCCYTPTMEGPYKVHVRFANREIPKSPFVVRVEGVAGDPSKVTASGPGLEKHGIMVKKRTQFDVFTKNAGFGVVDVVVVDPLGDKNSVRTAVSKVSDDEWHVEYVPLVEGLHAINVFFAGSPIPVSPVSIIVTPPIDASKVTVRGRGIQGTGVRVGDRAPFEIQTKNAGAGGQLSVKVTGPGGVEENVSVNTVDKLSYDCCYMPARPGKYSVNVSYGGQPIPLSPFAVRVLPVRQCKVRAFGPGLTRGMVGRPASFTVETNGETGTLGFSIEGPSQSRIECTDNEDGSAEISYFPLTPGDYAVHILVDNEDINNSPFMAAIQPTSSDFDPSKVVVSGKGLDPVGVIVNEPSQFVVDARGAGKAELNVGLRDVDLNPVEVSVKDNKDGTFLCSYVPTRSVRHMALIAYGGLAIPGSPFRMQVQERSDPSKVKVFGPAFTDKVETFKPIYFVVDCADAGPGDVAIALTDSRHQNVVVETTDNEDNTFTVMFEPTQVGEYVARVYFGDSEVPVSPLKINVLPSIDLSHVRVQRLDKQVFVESPVEFGVDLRSVGSDPDRRLKVIITAPSGDKMEALVEDNLDATCNCSFVLTEEGKHSIDVSYGDLPIPESPFVVSAVNGCDPSKVKAVGPGLSAEGLTFHPHQFTVDTKKAGKGGLGLAIEGPSEAKMTCRDNRDGTCDVEYLPIKRGVYDIAVKFAEEHIPGSPFRVRVKDELNPDRVRCFGSALDPKQVRLGQVVSLAVDASEAGEAPLDITVTDRHGVRQLPDVVSKADGLHEMSYQAKVEGQHKIKVLYGGRPVPDSPFAFTVLPVFEAKRVKVSGDGIHGPVSATLPTSFTVDTTEAGEADLQVRIKDAENREIPFTIANQAAGRSEVTYVTDSVGKLTVDVTYGREPVASSPFLVDVAPVGDITDVKIVGGVRSVVPVGELCCLVVDRSTGGNGRVTCHVKGDEVGDIKTEVADMDDGTSEVKYVLPQKGVYDVRIKFGGQPIPEGCFEQQAVDAENYASYLKEQEAMMLSKSVSSGLANGVIQNGFDVVDSIMSGLYNPVDFTIAVGPIFGFVKAEVTTPSGELHLPKIIDNRNGTVTIRYEPTEVGLHQMRVTYNDSPVDGSPFEFSVEAVRAGNVTAHGSGLVQGVAGTKCSFVINTANLGTNGLVVLVEGPSKTDIHVEDNDDNTCTVSYTPMLPGDYQVFIKFANRDIAGSPFSTKIIPASGSDDLQMVNMMIGSNKSEISLMVIEPDVDLLTASIRSPSGKETPCLLKSLVNGQLGISFSAKETGVHFVSVLRSGNHVKNSPFRMSIHEGQLCRVDRVRAFGKGLTDGRTNDFSEFFVNCKDAGFGNLSLSIEGPGRALLNCQEDEAGLCHVRYKPLQPGIYVINVRFADDHINGSPFLVQVKGRPTDPSSADTSDLKDNADITHVGCECLLRLAIQGINLRDLEATVVNPSFISEVCRVNELDQLGHYAISFVPQEIGVHRVSVRNRGVNIPGSPFRFTVGPIMEGGADRVQVIGMGLESGKVNFPGQFGIYTKEAGAGNLSVVMEGPSKAIIDIKDRLDGSCDVTYDCCQPGDYMLSIKFNGDDVPNSPFRIPVTSSSGQTDSTHSVNEDDVCQVNRPTSLLLSMSEEEELGSLKATVADPDGLVEPAFIQQLNHGRFAVRFVPHSNGMHKIHVCRNDRPVKGSPFLLIVGKQETNPALVHAQGEGLTKGWTGKPARFTVRTLDAGPGPLAVSVDGPSKVEVNCREVDDGYELTYTPRAPGLYQISLTYGGETHIPNSPFVVHVEGPGRPSAWNEQSQVIVDSQNKKTPREHDLTNGFDHHRGDEDTASLIASQGPGLHKGLVNRQATFNVDTSRAGQGILLIGVMGPSGPCEEVTIKHLGSGHYAVNYEPRERGNYLVVVRWGERHVHGSPFHVLVQ